MLRKAKNNKKGFTLAELLIVVAIIAVLVAISIPIFTAQLEKSRDAVSVSNIRAAYAEASAEYLTGDTNGTADTVKVEAEFKGTQAKWSGMLEELPFTYAAALSDDKGGIPGTYELEFSFDADGVCTLTTATKK